MPFSRHIPQYYATAFLLFNGYTIFNVSSFAESILVFHSAYTINKLFVPLPPPAALSIGKWSTDIQYKRYFQLAHSTDASITRQSTRRALSLSWQSGSVKHARQQFHHKSPFGEKTYTHIAASCRKNKLAPCTMVSPVKSVCFWHDWSSVLQLERPRIWDTRRKKVGVVLCQRKLSTWPEFVPRASASLISPDLPILWGQKMDGIWCLQHQQRQHQDAPQD